MLKKTAPALLAALLLTGAGAATALAQPPGGQDPVVCEGKVYALTSGAGHTVATICAEWRQASTSLGFAVWELKTTKPGVKVQYRVDRGRATDLPSNSGHLRSPVGSFELRGCHNGRCGGWTYVR